MPEPLNEPFTTERTYKTLFKKLKPAFVNDGQFEEEAEEVKTSFYFL